jgi:hypothetical protein
LGVCSNKPFSARLAFLFRSAKSFRDHPLAPRRHGGPEARGAGGTGAGGTGAGGSFVLQLWCPSPEIRRAAALQRAHEYADSARRDEARLAAFLTLISARLELDGELTLPELRAYARRAGRGGLSG